MGYVFTSESVTEGHPDKIADYISDSILDAYLKDDPMSRCAVETAAGKGFVHVFGEVTSKSVVDVESIVKDVFRTIGYTDESLGCGLDDLIVHNDITTQSPDIAAGVDESVEARDGSVDDYDRIGAGDQGIIFGYAEKGPKNMPLPIFLSHRIAERLTEARKNNEVDNLRPDAKTMVSIEYSDFGVPLRVTNVLVSTQHDEEANLSIMCKNVWCKVVEPVFKEYLDPMGITWDEADYLFNPSGRFVIGSITADSGLTGRKIVVDSYGGVARVGGGAYSGKDCTKVDRSAAYMARYVANNLVEAGLLEKCEIQLSYAIGKAEPVSVYINGFGTESISLKNIVSIVNEVFDLRPAAIIDHLKLRNPVYAETSNYGHYGRNGFTWEKLDKVDQIKYLAGLVQ